MKAKPTNTKKPKPTPTKSAKKGDPCPGCGEVMAPDEPVLECPGCARYGCSSCIPGGNKCLCPECEEEEGDDV